MINIIPHWQNFNDINNTLRIIEEFFHALRVKRYKQLIDQLINQELTDFEVEFKIAFYADDEEILTYDALILGPDKEKSLLEKRVVIDEHELFGNFEIDWREEITKLPTENPICWLTHEITDHAWSGVGLTLDQIVEKMITVDRIWCDLIIAEQVQIELVKEKC